jgi:ATP-dependent DNA helicase DinG
VADTAALTSATLAADGTFDHCKQSLGLAELPPERLQERVLATPFDLPEQMRILIPVYVPSPRGSSEEWVDAIGDLVTGAVRRYRRGTFVLTTSLDLLSRLAAKLAPVAQLERRTLLVQERDGSPAELLEEFRERRDAVLLGAANFWEGVDVVGEALEMLIVTRLPFDVPTEPWIAARHEKLAEEGKDAFYQLSLPEAILRLRQGLGRLIRHRKDRGIAIVADSRVFSARFGAVIRANLPVAAEAATSPAELWQMCDEFFEGGARESRAISAKTSVTGWTKSEP